MYEYPVMLMVMVFIETDLLEMSKENADRVVSQNDVAVCMVAAADIWATAAFEQSRRYDY